MMPSWSNIRSAMKALKHLEFKQIEIVYMTMCGGTSPEIADYLGLTDYQLFFWCAEMPYNMRVMIAQKEADNARR